MRNVVTSLLVTFLVSEAEPQPMMRNLESEPKLILMNEVKEQKVTSFVSRGAANTLTAVGIGGIGDAKVAASVDGKTRACHPLLLLENVLSGYNTVKSSSGYSQATRLIRLFSRIIPTGG